MSSGLYFIALIPPESIKENIQEIKLNFRDTYNSSHSLNAPPHITLLSPFRLTDGKENELSQILEELSSKLHPVKIELKDFDVFEPRVIFIDVIQSSDLTRAQKLIEEGARAYSEIFNYNYAQRPFHPHLTLAFKDLSKENFYKAWEEFKEKSFQADFVAEQICLLKHNGKRWNVAKAFDLG